MVLQSENKKKEQIKYKSKCMHEKPCLHYRNGICFLCEKDIYSLSECPKKLWKKYEDFPDVFSIILLPDFYVKKKLNLKKEKIKS